MQLQYNSLSLLKISSIMQVVWLLVSKLHPRMTWMWILDSEWKRQLFAGTKKWLTASETLLQCLRHTTQVWKKEEVQHFCISEVVHLHLFQTFAFYKHWKHTNNNLTFTLPFPLALYDHHLLVRCQWDCKIIPTCERNITRFFISYICITHSFYEIALFHCYWIYFFVLQSVIYWKGENLSNFNNLRTECHRDKTISWTTIQ